MGFHRERPRSNWIFDFHTPLKEKGALDTEMNVCPVMEEQHYLSLNPFQFEFIGLVTISVNKNRECMNFKNDG